MHNPCLPFPPPQPYPFSPFFFTSLPSFPSVGSRGKAPDQGVSRGTKSPWSWSCWWHFAAPPAGSGGARPPNAYCCIWSWKISCYWWQKSTNNRFLCPACMEGANRVVFVRPFVCPSVGLSVCSFVAYIANNSRSQRLSVPKFKRKVPHLRCDSHTSFKVKRSIVRVTRGDPLMLAHIVRIYLQNGKAYELQTWYTKGGRRPASATGTMTSKVKDKGRKVTWLVWAMLALWPIKSKNNSRIITKLCTWYSDKVPRRVWPTIAVTSKVKGQGHKLT